MPPKPFEIACVFLLPCDACSYRNVRLWLSIGKLKGILCQTDFKSIKNKGKKMAKMRQGLWRNVLRFLVKVSHIDLNEELLKENEYLKAEMDVYRKQLERLGKRPRFTDGMRRRLVGKALELG